MFKFGFCFNVERFCIELLKFEVSVVVIVGLDWGGGIESGVIVVDLVFLNVGVIVVVFGLVLKVGTDEDLKLRINNELLLVVVFIVEDIEGVFGWVVFGVDLNLDKEEELGVLKMDLVEVVVIVVVGVILNVGVVDVVSGLILKFLEGVVELLNEKIDCFEVVEVLDVICDWVIGVVIVLLLVGVEDDEVVCLVVFKEDRLKLKFELFLLEFCFGKENLLVVDVFIGCVGIVEIEGLVIEVFRLKLVVGCGLKLNWEGVFDVLVNFVFVVDVAVVVIGVERVDVRKFWLIWVVVVLFCLKIDLGVFLDEGVEEVKLKFWDVGVLNKDFLVDLEVEKLKVLVLFFVVWFGGIVEVILGCLDWGVGFILIGVVFFCIKFENSINKGIFSI